MVFIRAGLSGDVDLSGGAAELGGVNTGLDLKLLKRIDGWLENVGVEINVGVGDAVKSEVFPSGAPSRHGDGEAASCSAQAAGGLRGGNKAVGHVGAQRDKAEEVAVVQRQILDPRFVDHRADRRVLGSQ